MTPTTPTPAMSMSRVMCLGYISVPTPALVSITHTSRKDTRDKEEDAVHDAKREARLEHSTRLINSNTISIDVRVSKPEVDSITCASCVDLCAVGVSNET